MLCGVNAISELQALLESRKVAHFLLVHNSCLNKSLIADRIAALLLGYISLLTRSCNSSRYDSGSKKLTVFIHLCFVFLEFCLNSSLIEGLRALPDLVFRPDIRIPHS